MNGTPHISAKPSDFAKTVLMPGDPLRSAFIANTYLKNPVLINNVRGIQGYTGEWKGERVSVMASGMGMPSMGIYSYELFNFFDVENIIRVGTAGAISEKLRLHDVVLGMGACTNSNYSAQYSLPGTFSPIADYNLLRLAEENAKKQNLNYAVGNVLSSDVFYEDRAKTENTLSKWQKMNVLAVEMEAAALYMNAARAQKHALCVLTISDSLVTGEETTPEQRQTAFTSMMELALNVAVEA